MKILQVALGNQFDIRDAFAKHGDVVYFDWSGRNRSFNNDLIQLQIDHKPDLIFLQIQTPNILSPKVAKQLADHSIVVNWTGDVRQPLPHWYLEVGQHIHLSLFTNMNDVEHCRKFGVRADFLQIGLPNKIFTPKGEKREEAEIIFMGNNVGHFPLSKYRLDMVNALQQRYGSRFKCYGVNYPNASYEPQQTEEVKIYRGAKIGINVSHFNYERYTSDRMFRLMGSGVMCLSHNYNGIDEDFKDGLHIRKFDTIDGLCGLIDYYLEHDEERKAIAKQGCDYVHKTFTWEQSIKRLFELMK